MTTTAFDDQFTAAPEPVREPLSREAILKRNIADLEVELKQQTERAESYAETLRSIASYVGAGGYNADTVDAGVFEDKIRWGIRAIQGQLIAAIERAKTAEAELARMAQQKPVAWSVCRQLFRDSGPAILFASIKHEKVQQLYAAPVPAPHPGATHCDDCGLTWLDDGLNPLGCPYCKDATTAPAVPVEWRDVITELADDLSIELDMRYQSRSHYPSELRKYENEMQPVYRARALLQSAEVRHD